MFRLRANPLPHQCAVACCRKPRVHGKRFCHRHVKQVWRFNHPIINAWRTLVDNARRRKKEFTLTTAEFIEFIEATSYLDFKGRQRLCLHIDRIDHTRGYSRDNIQVLTCTQNTAKGNRERVERPF